MDRERRALIFANTTGENSLLNAALRDARIAVVSPGDFSTQSGDVSLVIVDRSPVQAVKICTNLRKEARFNNLPILVLLEGAEKEELSRLSTLSADILIKPVAARALQRYLNRDVIQAGKSDPPPVAAPRAAAVGSLAKEEAAADQQTSAPRSTAEIPRLSNTPEPVPIEDIVPSSHRLLRPVDGGFAFSGADLCSTCRRWDCRRDDRFCSRCGAPSIGDESPRGHISGVAHVSRSYEPLANQP